MDGGRGRVHCPLRARGMIFGSSRKVWGANKGLGEAPKSCTRKERESATNSIAKRGQGGDFVPFRLPLAGSRNSVPCGVWGNAPTVPRATSMPNALNKGAGSEASLPLTLRVRRRAPNLLIPTPMLCRAKWARPDSSACTQRTPKSTKEVSSCAPPPSPARPAKRTLPSR